MGGNVGKVHLKIRLWGEKEKPEKKNFFLIYFFFFRLNLKIKKMVGAFEFAAYGTGFFFFASIKKDSYVY